MTTAPALNGAGLLTRARLRRYTLGTYGTRERTALQ